MHIGQGLLEGLVVADDSSRDLIVVRTQPVECFIESNALRVEGATSGDSRGVPLANAVVTAENNKTGSTVIGAIKCCTVGEHSQRSDGSVLIGVIEA